MLIRLGYACISETLAVTSSSSYTYTQFCKDEDDTKLDQVIRSNLEALEQILVYNIKNHIHFYRLSSGIIPLATKAGVLYDYVEPYRKEYQRLGQIIKESNMRVDFHPNEYCVLNSMREEVVLQSIEILKYHYQLLEQLGIKNKVLILHIGSMAGGKIRSLSRFCRVFAQLDPKIQRAIAIENDDKVYNIDDCLELSKRLNIPIVFDYHHHICNPGKLTMDEFLPQVFQSWKGCRPKIHFSSPKSKQKKEFRSHHDYIDSDVFLAFLQKIEKYFWDIDVMIEAKKKDEALFRLIREIKYKTDYQFVDDTSFFIS